MKLNHLNLVVTNVAEAVIFFETYFNFKCTSVKGDNVLAILTGEDNFILVLMTTKESSFSYPDAFHVGFILEASQQVDETYAKLTNGGIPIRNGPRKIRDSYGFYFHYDNLMIEVGHYL